MKEHRRNIAVGITVILGLVLLGAMVLTFAKLPEQFTGGYRLKVRMDTTAGAEAGDFVYFRGIRVGRITDVSFADPDDLGKGVLITLTIDDQYRLPAAVTVAFTKGFMGNTYVEISPGGPKRVHPETGKPITFAPTDVTLEVEGHFRSTSPVDEFGPVLESFSEIGRELKPAMQSITRLAENINRMIAPAPGDGNAPTTGPADGNTPTELPQGLAGTTDRLNRTLDALYAVLGDAENRDNIKSALANLSEASAKMSEAMDAVKQIATDANAVMSSAEGTLGEISKTAVAARKDFDAVTAKVVTGAEDLSKLLTTMRKVVGRIEEGEGSAGKLLKDPKLYNELVDTVKQMKELAKDLRALAQTWKKTGLQVKLK